MWAGLVIVGGGLGNTIVQPHFGGSSRITTELCKQSEECGLPLNCFGCSSPLYYVVLWFGELGHSLFAMLVMLYPGQGHDG